MRKSNQSVSHQSPSELPESSSLTLSRFLNSKGLKMLLAPLSVVALTGLGSISWLPTEAKAQTAAPRNTAAQTNTARVSLTLNRQPNESFDTLLRRGEAVAREAAARTFNQNPSARAVSVKVLGQNEGAIAPILSLDVSRQNWATRPDPRRWATYFQNAQSLLRINTSAVNVANQGAPGQVLPNGTVVTGNGTQVLPNGTVVTGNGTQVLPNGTVVTGNGAAQGNNAVNGAANGVNNTNGTNNGNGVNGTNLNNTTGTTGTNNGNGVNGTNLNNTNGTNNGNGVNGTNLNNTNGTNAINNPSTPLNDPAGNTGINNGNGGNGTTLNNSTGTNGTNGERGGNSTSGNGTGSTGTTGGLGGR